METLEAIERLAAQARREQPPQTDVRINHLLQACRRETAIRVNLKWPALLSALAACILLALAMHFSSSTNNNSDSVSSLFAPMQVEMP